MNQEPKPIPQLPVVDALNALFEKHPECILSWRGKSFNLEVKKGLRVSSGNYGKNGNSVLAVVYDPSAWRFPRGTALKVYGEAGNTRIEGTLRECYQDETTGNVMLSITLSLPRYAKLSPRFKTGAAMKKISRRCRHRTHPQDSPRRFVGLGSGGFLLQ